MNICVDGSVSLRVCDLQAIPVSGTPSVFVVCHGRGPDLASGIACVSVCARDRGRDCLDFGFFSGLKIGRQDPQVEQRYRPWRLSLQAGPNGKSFQNACLTVKVLRFVHIRRLLVPRMHSDNEPVDALK